MSALLLSHRSLLVEETVVLLPSTVVFDALFSVALPPVDSMVIAPEPFRSREDAPRPEIFVAPVPPIMLLTASDLNVPAPVTFM